MLMNTAVLYHDVNRAIGFVMFLGVEPPITIGGLMTMQAIKCPKPEQLYYWWGQAIISDLMKMSVTCTRVVCYQI